MPLPQLLFFETLISLLVFMSIGKQVMKAMIMMMDTMSHFWPFFGKHRLQDDVILLNGPKGLIRPINIKRSLVMKNNSQVVYDVDL